MSNTTHASIAPKGVDLTRLWLVTGRVSGDDVDSIHIVEAPDARTAERLFIERVQHNNFGHEDAPVYMLCCTPLCEAIEQRVS